MKKYLIISGLSIFIILIGLLSFYFHEAKKYKQLNEDKTTILSTKEAIFKNDSLESVSRVKVWSLKYSNLEKAHEKVLKDRSDYEVLLAKAYDAIKLADVKTRKLKEYYESVLSSKDTVYQLMKGDCELKPIHTKFYDIGFVYTDSIVAISHSYHTGQNIVVSLFPKLKANGEKHWPNWGWLYGWDNTSTWTVEDTNAVITNQISVEFKK